MTLLTSPLQIKSKVLLMNHKFAQIIFALFLCLALVFILSKSVFAYATEGGRWSSSQISIGFYDSQQSYDRQGWIDGYNAWNNANTHIHFTANGGTLDVHDTNNSNVTWDGITYYTINAFGYFTGVDAYLNIHFTSGYSRGTIQEVAAHELGHAVGLAHVSSCVLMNPYTGSRCGNTPKQDDINGINSLY